MDNKKRFKKIENDFDDLSKSYDVLIPKLVPGYKDLESSIISKIKALKLPAATFLDIGCGTALLGESILKLNANYEYVGLDISAQMVKTANSRLNRFDKRYAVIKEDALKIGQINLPKIDVIVSNLALHHFENKVPVYNEIFKLAKQNNATFILGDLVVNPFSDPQAYKFRFQHMLHSGMSEREVKKWFARWKEEDNPSSISDNIGQLKKVGFSPELIWKNMNYASFVCAV